MKVLAVTGGSYGQEYEDRQNIYEKTKKAVDALGGAENVMMISKHDSVSEFEASFMAVSMGVQTVVYSESEHGEKQAMKEKCAAAIADHGKPDAVLVFPGGCEVIIEKCRAAGAKVWRVKA